MRRADGGWFRDRFAGFSEAIEVERDCLADQPLHILLGVSDDADAGKVGTVGAP